LPSPLRARGSFFAFDMAATASDVALGEVRRLLAAWQVHEPAARLGHDPEALHQLRVTGAPSRRDARSVQTPAALALSHARKTAKHVLRTLGAARDLDVQLAELAHYCAGLPEQERYRVGTTESSSRGRAGAGARAHDRALDSEPTRRWLEKP